MYHAADPALLPTPESILRQDAKHAESADAAILALRAMHQQYTTLADDLRHNATTREHADELRNVAISAQAAQITGSAVTELARRDDEHRAALEAQRSAWAAEVKACRAEIVGLREAHAAEVAELRGKLGRSASEAEALWERRRAAVEAQGAERLALARAEHAKVEASLRRALKVESQRLNDTRQECLELTTLLGNARYERRSEHSHAREEVAHLRQREHDILLDAQRDEAVSQRANQQLLDRLSRVERAQEKNRTDAHALDSNAQTAAALLHQLQRERAEHEVAHSALGERLAACEKALRHARHSNALLREELEAAEEELFRLRMGDTATARRMAAARSKRGSTLQRGATPATGPRSAATASAPLLRHQRGAAKWIEGSRGSHASVAVRNNR